MIFPILHFEDATVDFGRIDRCFYTDKKLVSGSVNGPKKKIPAKNTYRSIIINFRSMFFFFFGYALNLFFFTT